MSDVVNKIQTELRSVASKKRAEASKWYFKSEPGVVDEFLGITVPNQRLIAKKYYRNIGCRDVEKLLHSNVHEERLTALIMWVLQYKKAKEQNKKVYVDLYLENTKWINNWDLVDTSARDIVGEYLFTRDRSILMELSRSSDVWERRIAIIATSYFIQYSDFEWTLKLAEHYLNDTHHYIHKATGWMLREVGKRDQKVLVRFLNTHAAHMPRTMLRYAIEKFDTPTRQAYLAIKQTALQ